MKKNLKWLLEISNVSIKELSDMINQQGGRDPDKPIIYPEKCHREDCEVFFFSNTQDHMMRLNNGYPTLCPACREVDRRDKKRNYARNRVKSVKNY